MTVGGYFEAQTDPFMQTNSARNAGFLLLLCAAGSAFGALQGRVDARELDRLSLPHAAGERIQIARVPVGVTLRTLDLEKFDVWSPDARIVLDAGSVIGFHRAQNQNSTRQSRLRNRDIRIAEYDKRLLAEDLNQWRVELVTEMRR